MMTPPSPAPDQNRTENTQAKNEAPLTHAQESLYFLQQLTGGQPVYNMPQAFRLRGRLDLDALSHALRWLADQHDALRASIKDRAGGPVQKIGSGEKAVLRLHQAASESVLRENLQAAVREPFDLENGPIFRTDLFRLNDQEHVLLINLHHVVGDMSSLGIIYRDLSRAYAACAAGRVPAREGQARQLSEYAAGRRAKPVAGETIQFWKENLKDHRADLELTLDRFRPKYPSFRGAAYYFDLPAGLPGALRELARKNRSSLYMVSLAGLQALLHRYTGQQKFALATPFTDREDPALEDTVGYLVNLLPIACDVRPEESFRALLGKVRQQCLAVYGHHDISFRRILQELGISSDSPKPPLARVVFQYFPEIADLELNGLVVEPMQVHSQTSKFDICVSMAERGDAITTEIEYDTDLFEEGSIQRFARHLSRVLQAAVNNPDRPIGELDLLDAAERALLAEWNQTQVPYPRNATVHGLFEEQVQAGPERVALKFDGQAITYGELNALADRVADELREAGVSAGAFVGVCLDRSPELIAALIGILKAGAAFVPIEASYPKARLDYLFADASVNLLVTHSKHAHLAPPDTRMVLMDQLPAGKGAPAAAAVSAESPAYMMYTSGSTGQPKGAVIPHRAIIRLVKNNDFASMGERETFLAFAPVSFDASTLEIWGPLLNGGTLAIYPPQFESVEQFEAVVRDYGVTTLWLTAGLFNTLVDRKPEALRGVRQLLAGGDVLSVAHVRKALAALPETELINGYGPTENTTFTCCYRIPRDLPGDRSIPIGRPIRNTTVWILDERMQQVPPGVPGDLYAGGDGLAAGYWKKPELTTATFVPHPFAPGERLYKTGDRARFLEDGSIEFLGRRDAQVKIRGFRIEIEEVEGAFRKVPGVLDVAVVAHSDGSGGKSLVAYIVLARGCSISAAQLQGEAGKLLPAHACPSRIFLLQELPLGPNGKVDRQALPAPAALHSAELEKASPANSIEAKLIEVWRQILEVPDLSIDDNFFLLGGESLRATRAISQMNALFDCRLTLPRIFEAPTVRQMARIVENARESSDSGRLPAEAPMRINKDVDVGSLSEQDVDALLAQLLDESRRN